MSVGYPCNFMRAHSMGNKDFGPAALSQVGQNAVKLYGGIGRVDCVIPGIKCRCVVWRCTGGQQCDSDGAARCGAIARYPLHVVSLQAS